MNPLQTGNDTCTRPGEGGRYSSEERDGHSEFPSDCKIRRLRVPMAKLQLSLLKPLSRGVTGEIWLVTRRWH
ncbi:hypothetical protein GN244_ATG09313 [Phytophthora infestans]|uniref:Uncharacterized protein n=1 Tax=Phytophthora infestans TaxID=4787 RepID=A0A833SU94_PHYIN|nr:hypothetical protein GN244_ATG09313 [Phytophthora infestans]